jgi:hypothetical protein
MFNEIPSLENVYLVLNRACSVSYHFSSTFMHSTYKTMVVHAWHSTSIILYRISPSLLAIVAIEIHGTFPIKFLLVQGAYLGSNLYDK